jgi:hypothetical protein
MAEPEVDVWMSGGGGISSVQLAALVDAQQPVKSQGRPGDPLTPLRAQRRVPSSMTPAITRSGRAGLRPSSAPLSPFAAARPRPHQHH